MTDLIVIDDISDELPPAFMILDDESCQNITQSTMPLQINWDHFTKERFITSTIILVTTSTTMASFVWQNFWILELLCALKIKMVWNK